MHLESTPEIDSWFTHHPPEGDQADRYGAIRAAGRQLALHVVALAPAGPDRDRALAASREAVMWANVAIACGEADEADEGAESGAPGE